MGTSSRGYGTQTGGRRHTMGFVAAAAAGLIVLCTSSRSEACSCLEPTGIQKSLPENGAQGVPTDVVIWSQGADIELVDEDGDVVPSHLELKRGDFCTGSRLLTPDVALDPTSTYTLRAVADSGALADHEVAAISFSTGEGALGGSAPPAPSIRVAAFDASNYLNSCVYSQSQVCMQTSYEGLIDVHLTRDGSAFHYVAYPETLANLELGDARGETCLSVQARDLAGRLSEKTEVCVDFSTAPVIGDGGGPLFLDCNDERLRPYYVSSDEPEPTGEGGADGRETNTETDDQESEEPKEVSGCAFPSSVGGAASAAGPLGWGFTAGLASLLLWMRRRRLAAVRT